MQYIVLGAACILSCHPEDDHHVVHLHPAAADRDHPNQGHLPEVHGQLGGKSSGQVQATIYVHICMWCSHCASKTYIRQNTLLENLRLSFGRFVMLVYSCIVRKHRENRKTLPF